MKYPLYKDMALTCDIPGHKLRRGDVVRVVDRHTGPGGAEGYSIEIFNAVGDTVTVTTVSEAALEPLRSDEIFAIRRIESAAA
jgi:hypothetical protein